MQALLAHYGAEGRLYGHGVGYSPTSAPDAAARAWLARLATDPWRYRHVTEHWGFARVPGIARNAPLPVHACDAAVTQAVAALRALAAVARVPVGLENLALAQSAADAHAQPAMLARVLDAVDGVLLLDLHNVWCQAVNYGLDVHALIARYPLARVRELHVAGGSWSEVAGGRFRRDTHDALVPDEVLQLVAWTIARCPHLEVVILERIPDALDEPAAWRDEFARLAAIVHAATPSIEPPAPPVLALPHTTPTELSAQQAELVAALRRGAPCPADWDPRAWEVATILTARWLETD